MSSRTLKISSGASTNLTEVGPTSGAEFIGIQAVNTSTAAAAFVKLYWGVPGTFSGGGIQPTVGTDIPLVTYGVPVAVAATNPGQFTSPPFSGDAGPRGPGQLYVAITGAAADADTTATAAGQVLLSVFYQ